MEVLSARVAVRFTENVTYYPTEAWTLPLPEVGVPVEEVKEALAALTTLNGQLEYPVSNRMTVHTTQTDWGASGSFGEFILELSQGAIGGAGGMAMAAGLKITFDKVKSRVQASPSSEPIDRAQAAQLVRNHIELHYSEPAASLTETSSATALDTNTHEFTFKNSSGREYGGTAGEVSGSPTCTRVWYKSDEPRARTT